MDLTPDAGVPAPHGLIGVVADDEQSAMPRDGRGLTGFRFVWVGQHGGAAAHGAWEKGLARIANFSLRQSDCGTPRGGESEALRKRHAVVGAAVPYLDEALLDATFNRARAVLRDNRVRT